MSVQCSLVEFACVIDVRILQLFRVLVHCDCSVDVICLCDQKSLQVVEPPEDVTVREGETARFVCRVSPCMPLPSVSWFYETGRSLTLGSREQLDRSERFEPSLSEDGEVALSITSVQHKDAGVYTMVASNTAGMVEVSALLTVHGLFLFY